MSKKLHVCLVGEEEIHPFAHGGTGHIVTAEGDWICTKHFKSLGFKGFLDAGRYARKITNAQVKEIQVKGYNGPEYMQGAGQSASISAEAKFDPDYKVGAYLSADTNAQIIRITTSSLSMKPNLAFAYSDLVSFHVVEDGNTVSKNNGVGRAVGGGLIFGPVGALVGAMTKKTTTKSFVTDLHIDLTLQNHAKVSYRLPMLTSKTKPGFILDAARKSATEIAAFLETVQAQNTAAQMQPTNNPSAAEQLREIKQLLDDGIRQADFDAKKQQLLEL